MTGTIRQIKREMEECRENYRNEKISTKEFGDKLTELINSKDALTDKLLQEEKIILTVSDIENLIESNADSLENYFHLLNKNSVSVFRGVDKPIAIVLSEDYRNAMYDSKLLKKFIKEVPKTIDEDIILLDKLYDLLTVKKQHAINKQAFNLMDFTLDMIPDIYARIAKEFPHLAFKEVIEFEKRLRAKGKLLVHDGKYFAAERSISSMYSRFIRPTAWTCCPHMYQEKLGFVEADFLYNRPPAWASAELKLRYKCPRCNKNNVSHACSSCKDENGESFYIIKSVSGELLEVQLITDPPYSRMFSKSIDPRPDSGCATSKKMFYYNESNIQKTEEDAIAELNKILTQRAKSLADKIKSDTDKVAKINQIENLLNLII